MFHLAQCVYVCLCVFVHVHTKSVGLMIWRPLQLLMIMQEKLSPSNCTLRHTLSLTLTLSLSLSPLLSLSPYPHLPSIPLLLSLWIDMRQAQWFSTRPRCSPLYKPLHCSTASHCTPSHCTSSHPVPLHSTTTPPA